MGADSSKQKLISKIIRNHRYLLIGVTFAILFLAGCNHLYITWNVNRDYKSVLSVLNRWDSVYKSDSSFVFSSNLNVKTDSGNISPEVKRISEETPHTLRQILYEIESNKKGLFDSNVITFLISFVLVGLIAIFFENDKKITDRMKGMEVMRFQIKQEIDEKIGEMDTFWNEAEIKVSSYEKKLNLFKQSTSEDQRITWFMNNIQTIQLIAIHFYIELSRKNKDIDSSVNEYARMIDTEIESLISDLNRGRLCSISSHHKEIILNMLDKIQTYLSFDHIADSESKPVVLRTLLLTQQHLQDLYERIVLLKVPEPEQKS